MRAGMASYTMAEYRALSGSGASLLAMLVLDFRPPIFGPVETRKEEDGD